MYIVNLLTCFLDQRLKNQVSKFTMHRLYFNGQTCAVKLLGPTRHTSLLNAQMSGRLYFLRCVVTDSWDLLYRFLVSARRISTVMIVSPLSVPFRVELTQMHLRQSLLGPPVA